MFTVPKKLSLRLSLGWLSPRAGLTPTISMFPCGFPNPALAHLRGVGVVSWLSLGHGSAHQLLPKAADGGKGIQMLASPWEQCLCMDGHHSITEGVG